MLASLNALKHFCKEKYKFLESEAENCIHFRSHSQILQLNEYNHNKFIAFPFMQLFSIHLFRFLYMKIIVQKSFIHEPDGDEKENEKSVRKSWSGH